MEVEVVESNGAQGGGTDRRTSSKKDRRIFWAGVFILVNNCFSCTAYFGVSTNLVNYFQDRLHEGSKAAANGVTNWTGTGSITPLVAAFVADAFLGRYWTIVLFLLVSVLAYAVLTVSAAAALHAEAFYAGLYLLCLGGALQPVLSSFGADQFEESDDEQSSFFNWFYMSINVGSLVGGTVLVWVQTRFSWGLGYGIPAAFSVLAVAAFLAGTATYRRHQPPGGSPLTRVAQVVVAAVRKWGVDVPDDASELHEFLEDGGMSSVIQGSRRLAHTDQFRFLDKAAVVTDQDKAGSWRLCTVTQVEELKCVLRLLPVWASGIVFAAAYTQMSTTFVLQGDTLDPHVGGFRVPAAALSVFDTLSVMLWVPLYDRVIVPLARRATGCERGFTQLARMGVGLVVLAAAMLTAGTLEVARRRVIARHGYYYSHTGADGEHFLPLSIFWQVPQYVVVGASEVFTFIGQMEFFYDQAPDAMRSLCSGLSMTSFALGNYVSSALVTVVARATARDGRDGWIPDNINRGHLDDFFWLLALLCFGNFGVYLLIARWYKYKKIVD